MMNKSKPNKKALPPSLPRPTNQSRKPVYKLSPPAPPTTTHNQQTSKPMKEQLVNTRPMSTTSVSLAIEDRRHSDEVKAKNLCKEITAYCRQANIHFVDDQFPPTALSLGAVDFNDHHPLQWLRIAHISPLSYSEMALPWSVYSSPQPSDIQQGALGDCWLMAGLALITERPEMLNHILLTKNVNQEGVYLVRLCHNGLWKIVLVDDCFPCTQYNQLAFTQANRRQLFVPLIEKACAKLFGSYGDIIGGRTEEGLQLLTGAPCDHIDLHPTNSTIDQDLVWAKLLSACECQLIIGASTGRGDISENEYARLRIHGNHAFSVLGAHSLPEIAMNFVLVRDPHARSSYIDEYLSSGTLLRKLNSLYSSKQSTGGFWISWPVFLRLFSSITISTYSKDYYDVREVGRFTESSLQSIPAYHFHVSRSSMVNISLIYHRENRRVRNYHTQSFVLCNVEQSGRRDVGTSHAIFCSGRGAFTHWIGSLPRGTYVLIPFSTSFWTDNTRSPRDYTVVIHSTVQIDVQVIPEPPALLADCLIATVLKGQNILVRERDFTCYATSTQSDVMLFVAENSSQTNYLTIDLDLDDSQKIRHSRGALITRDSIPPRHRQILFLVEWANKEGERARMEYQYFPMFTHQPTQSVPQVCHSQGDFHAYRPF